MESQATTKPVESPPELIEIVPGQIWKKTYKFTFSGFLSPFGSLAVNMTVVKLQNGKLWVHSPSSPLSGSLRSTLAVMGEVGYIIAPSDVHYANVPEWQVVYHEAKTYFSPGLEAKEPSIKYTKILREEPEPDWIAEFPKQVSRACSHRRMCVLMPCVLYHTPSPEYV